MKMPRLTLALVTLLISMAPFAAAQLVCSPNNFSLPGDSVATVTVTDANGAHVKFKYAGVDHPPNFIVVIPSSGTTPAAVQIGVNPNVAAQFAPKSTHALTAQFTTVEQAQASTAGVLITYFGGGTRVPANVSSAANSASLQSTLSPGALVSIFGSNLADLTQSTTFDDTGNFPTSAADTAVTFNGAAAPLLYVSPGQINAVVPFSVAGQTSAQITVSRLGQAGGVITVPLQDTAPAIFTSSQTGTGQAAVLQLTRNGPFYDPPSYNSSSNPAHAGDYLEIFATGQGLWTPPAQSDVFLVGERFTTQPVSLTIGASQRKSCMREPWEER
jgi:uncharacterized protein (TIGR03437 family)